MIQLMRTSSSAKLHNCRLWILLASVPFGWLHISFNFLCRHSGPRNDVLNILQFRHCFALWYDAINAYVIWGPDSSSEEAPHHVLNSYVPKMLKQMWRFVFCRRLQLLKRLWCLSFSHYTCQTHHNTYHIRRHSNPEPSLSYINERYPNSVIGIIMDREYTQYLKQEAIASAKRAISRAVAVTIYSVAGVYLLSSIMSDVLPKVAAILPIGSNAVGYQDEVGVNLQWDRRDEMWAWSVDGFGSGNQCWRYADAGAGEKVN